MKLRYSKTLLEAQENESPIADVCWSPNNVKVAVATCERVVLLFDTEGVRRDKFSTKPADANAGKKSYVITSLAFSENSELLGVAQSDSMVFVYRVGADWAGKKVICNKFPLSGAPTRLLPAERGFYAGTADGKIRMLDCKSNKSASLWSAGACCVALARAPARDGAVPLASGHVDGTLYLNGRLVVRYGLPPTVVVVALPYLVVGSCDGRVAVYEAARGALVRSVEPPLPAARRDLLAAAAGPGGQTIAFGVFDGVLIGELRDSGVLELSLLGIGRLHAARALAWSADGARLAVASQAGAVILLEAVLRRWTWRGAVEVQHASARALVLTRLGGDAPPLAVRTRTQHDIHDVRFIGNDWYAVCRTSSTLILVDIARRLTSEIPWSGGGERVYAAAGGACLLHRAGELSVVEYGLDRVLHTVRTERVNPHVISVRINEATEGAEGAAGEGAEGGGEDRKHLAYLLDRQTVAVVDLVTGATLGQWWHPSRVDWLELSGGARLLLLRDTRRRLALLRLDTGEKEIIASGVTFVQWVENTDALVAQTPTHLLVWYSAWDSGAVETLETGGGAATAVVGRRVTLDGGAAPALLLDEHRLAFNAALGSGDLQRCAEYLAGAGADVATLWRQLAARAADAGRVELAAQCYRAVGDDARTFYLDETARLAAREGGGDVQAGLQSPLVQARLAIFAGDLPAAEEVYVRADRPEMAVQMYRQFNRWNEAIQLAERTDRAAVPALRQQHMDYLTSTGRLGEAGAALAAAGELREAVRLWLRGGRARRAAAALLQHADLLRDAELCDAVHAQLIQEEWWEMAGELSERKGDHAAAVKYYAKGNNYGRAVQLAREACPGEVTRLERAWGGWLVAARQPGAAVPHLIEAGDTRAALAAALAAHHYKKALQIVEVIEDKESIKAECESLADHFISVQDWETAERVLTACGEAARCVRAYAAAGRHGAALRLAARALSEQEARALFAPLALQLREEGQLRQAEQIYIGLGEHDEAIAMYKDACQYEAMLRLVGAHRGPLLEATRRHVAQALHAAGDLRAAEKYYLEADDWKSAIQMYRAANEWEHAERVARACAPAAVQQQTALLRAAALGGAAAARLLAARGMAALGAQWALQAQRWDIAYELSALGGGVARRDVARAEAAALAGERPASAEAAFLRAAAPADAVRMWLERGDCARALTLAEQHAPDMVEEVLVEGARAAAERGDLAQFEALLLRANRPRDVVAYYKELELWEEAARVSKEYLPDSAEPVPPSVPPALQRAAEHADRGEWWQAVALLCAASETAAAAGAARLAERAALRAAKLARDRLDRAARARIAPRLAERFEAIGQSDVWEQLKAVLVEDSEGEDDGGGEAAAEHSESEAREAGAAEALERLAAGGQWERCLARAGARAPHYALRCAQHVFKTQPRTASTDIDSEEPSEALAAALDVLRRHFSPEEKRVAAADAPLARSVSAELLLRASLTPKAFTALKDCFEMLLALAADEKLIQACTLLMSLHVPAVAGRAARALPRYCDVIVADVAFLAAGRVVRAEVDGAREAFVLLNRCLDLAEAADDASAHLLDYTDFECTDWSRAPLLLPAAAVGGAALADAREWVLAVSMDTQVEQTLPLDSRSLHAACVPSGEPCCVLTGYPLGSRLVTFTNGRCANREWWSRGSRAAAPAGDVLACVQLWCGPADYAPL